MTFNPVQDDPADFKATEVTDGLAQASAEDLERVKAMEESGQARQSILNFQPTADKVKPSDDGYKRVPVADPYPVPAEK